VIVGVVRSMRVRVSASVGVSASVSVSVSASVSVGVSASVNVSASVSVMASVSSSGKGNKTLRVVQWNRLVTSSTYAVCAVLFSRSFR
jgi:hypothetical protein